MQLIRLFSPLILVPLALAAGSGSRAQETSPLKARNTIHEYQIAMRDGVRKTRVNRTRMTRMRRIFADILFVLSAPIRSDLCNPRSIPIFRHGTL
jgi:hypothetical protein